MTYGLPKPEKEPLTVNEMRLAIDRGWRDSAIIGNCLNRARYNGSSGEDTYVLLAYYALRELEKFYQMNMDWMNLQPDPQKIVVGSKEVVNWKAADEEVGSKPGLHYESNRVALPGYVWVCGACGKTSRDRYGHERISRGWDESCMLNAVLCLESNQTLKERP
jgi:hypothetical protein